MASAAASSVQFLEDVYGIPGDIAHESWFDLDISRMLYNDPTIELISNIPTLLPRTSRNPLESRTFVLAKFEYDEAKIDVAKRLIEETGFIYVYTEGYDFFKNRIVKSMKLSLRPITRKDAMNLATQKAYYFHPDTLSFLGLDPSNGYTKEKRDTDFMVAAVEDIEV